MTTMVTEVYDALLSAGAEEPKARAAAQAMALPINELGQRLDRLERDVAIIKSELVFHRWAFGFMIALQFVILGKLLVLHLP